MGLVTFSLIMISLLLFTVKDNEWGKIAHIVKGIAPGFTVYYDGYCNYCRRTARIIRFLDCFGLFRVISYRHDNSYLQYGLSFEDVDKEMYIICSITDSKESDSKSFKVFTKR